MEKNTCDTVLISKITELSDKVSNLERLVHDLDSSIKVLDTKFQNHQTNCTTHMNEFMEYKEVIAKFKENIIVFKTLCSQIVDGNKQSDKICTQMRTSLTALKQDFKVEGVRFEQFQEELKKMSELIEKHDDEFTKIIATQTSSTNSNNTIANKIVDTIRNLQKESSTLHDQCAVLVDEMSRVKSDLQDMNTTSATLKKVFGVVVTLLTLFAALAGIDFISGALK